MQGSLQLYVHVQAFYDTLGYVSDSYSDPSNEVTDYLLGFI